MFTETLSQALAVVGQIPASNHAVNTDVSVAGIDMSIFRRLITYLDVGAGGGNVQAYYKSSATANMASSTNLGNSALYTNTTQLVGTTTSNRVQSIEIRADQLPAGHRYVIPAMTVVTTATNAGLICLGGEASYKPASQFDTANVRETALVVAMA